MAIVRKLGLQTHKEKVALSQRIKHFAEEQGQPLVKPMRHFPRSEWCGLVAAVQDRFGSRHPQMEWEDWSDYIKIITRDSSRSLAKAERLAKTPTKRNAGTLEDSRTDTDTPPPPVPAPGPPAKRQRLVEVEAEAADPPVRRSGRSHNRLTGL